MKVTHKEELYIKKDNLSDCLFDETSIFFDIETTGFSPAHSSIYLIGCARKSGKHILIDQFFAEKPEEEKEILESFMKLLSSYKTIISFNGVGFDIPFIKAKCNSYGISENLKDYEYLDIFKMVSSIKFLLNLENYKQKTIEKFLGLTRDDKYTGGDLINVYLDYVKNQTQEAFDLLHLHNYEDVIGMLELFPILSYIELFHGQYTIKEVQINPYQNLYGKDIKELLIILRNDYAVPQQVSCHFNDFFLTIKNNTAQIRVPIYVGELRYFYPNYKDYYYLPKEDMAVHKSVANFVDGDYKERCRSYNCYTRKTGEFLPQYAEIMKPEFKKEVKDKMSYVELTDDFCSSDIMLRRYADHVLDYLMNHAK